MYLAAIIEPFSAKTDHKHDHWIYELRSKRLCRSGCCRPKFLTWRDELRGKIIHVENAFRVTVFDDSSFKMIAFSIGTLRICSIEVRGAHFLVWIYLGHKWPNRQMCVRFGGESWSGFNIGNRLFEIIFNIARRCLHTLVPTRSHFGFIYLSLYQFYYLWHPRHTWSGGRGWHLRRNNAVRTQVRTMRKTFSTVWRWFGWERRTKRYAASLA